MKIVHLSDLHCAGREDTRFARLVSRIVEQCHPGIHVICITGDFVDDGTSEGAFEEPRRQVEILRANGFVVLAVPGNHDYGTGSRFGADVQQLVAEFKQTFLYHQSEVKNLMSPEFYPNLDIVELGQKGCAFIGLDSNEGELGSWYKRYGADGRFGNAQLNRLKEMLYTSEDVRSADHRVIYFHHHGYECVLPEVIEEFHELHDREQFGDLLAKYHADFPFSPVSALLYGHEHYFRMEEQGLWGVGRCYDAGSSTGKLTDGLKKWYLEKYKKIPPTAKIRIIDLDGDDEIVEWL